jgi:hypothetical protein
MTSKLRQTPLYYSIRTCNQQARPDPHRATVSPDYPSRLAGEVVAIRITAVDSPRKTRFVASLGHWLGNYRFRYNGDVGDPKRLCSQVIFGVP